MLGRALLLLTIAIVVGGFGFFVLVGIAASLAKILFLVLLVLFVVTLVSRLVQGDSNK